MKKIIIFFMTLVLIFTVAGCGKKPTATIENEDIRRSSYKFDLTVDSKDMVTKGSVLVNFYKISNKDESLFTTKTLTTFSETVSVTGMESDTNYRCDVLGTYNKKSHVIYSWVIKTKKDGTQFDPIVINTANELVEYLSNDYSSDAYYELGQDIDFTTYSKQDDEGNNVEFSGLATTSSTAFCGYLNGKGHTIKNVTISSDVTYNGFFGYLKGTLEDVNFENINITVNRSSSSTTYTGSVCGYGYQAKLINVNVKNATLTVDAKTQYTGGVIGYSFATNTTYSKNEGITITAKGTSTVYVGGLTAYLCQNSSSRFGKVYHASVDGTVTMTCGTTVFYGGLVGFVKAGSYIDRSIANMNATITSYGNATIGGLVGQAKLNGVDDTKIEYIKNVVAKGSINYKTIKEEELTLNNDLVMIGGLIGSATTVKINQTYIEMDIDIEAKMDEKGSLYAGLVYGCGYEYHTELHNAIINGTIKSKTTDSHADATISVYGYDGSTYIEGGVEKTYSIIDNLTVGHVTMTVEREGVSEDYDGAISITDAASVAQWDSEIWTIDVDSTNKKINVSFK